MVTLFPSEKPRAADCCSVCVWPSVCQLPPPKHTQHTHVLSFWCTWHKWILNKCHPDTTPDPHAISSERNFYSTHLFTLNIFIGSFHEPFFSQGYLYALLVACSFWLWTHTYKIWASSPQGVVLTKWMNAYIDSMLKWVSTLAETCMAVSLISLEVGSIERKGSSHW